MSLLEKPACNEGFPLRKYRNMPLNEFLEWKQIKMAKKKKKKGLTTIHKIAIVAVVLIAVEAVFLLSRGGDKAVNVREAIDKAVASRDSLDDKGKLALRLQLSINDFQSNNTRLPNDLGELVPKYFDIIPTDPDTNKPYAYQVKGGHYFIGEPTTTASREDGKGGSGAKGGDRSITQDEQQALIASLSEPPKEDIIYDPTGKRDPFRPFNFAPEEVDENKTELERYALGQLRLTAVLDGFEEPKAIVENAAGRGFTVQKGMKIGQNNGVIVDIQESKLLILETTIDFAGKKKTRTVELTLRTKDQQKS